MKHMVCKRVGALLLALCLALGICPALPVRAADGDVIEIGSAEDFLALTQENFSDICDAEIVLTADINMAGKAAIAPIGSFADPTAAVPFEGVFDGNGYTIEGLSISSENHCAGLFSYVGTDGVVKNLNLIDLFVDATDCNNVGALAGVSTGTISHCAVSGTVKGKANVGGLAGILHGGTIANCMVTVDVAASGTCAGGLFANANYNNRGENNYNGSPLFACLSTQPMNVVNNLILGSVSANTQAGGLLGDFGNSLTSKLGDFSGNVVHISSLSVKSAKASYGYAYAWWTDSTSRSVASENVYVVPEAVTAPENSTPFSQPHVNFVEKTTSVLSDPAFFEDLGWDLDRVWYWDEQLKQPVLWDVKEIPVPLYIDSANELYALFTSDKPLYSKQEIYLEADIDMTGYDAVSPLGGEQPFNGIFDGQDHVISNLIIKSTDNCTGLFGVIGTKGSVKNLGLENITVTGSHNTGAIAGLLSGSVSKCYVTGTVTGTDHTGGLAGMLYGGSIDNCWLNTQVTGANRVGGLFGGTNWTDSNGLLSEEAAAAITSEMTVTDVVVLGTVTGGSFTGGLLGDMGNSKASKLGAFSGIVVRPDSVTSTTTSFASVYGWWSTSSSRAAAGPNCYSDSILLSGSGESSVVLRDYAKFDETALSTLCTRSAYVNLGWDFNNIWLWSTKLEHPVFRDIPTPAMGEPLDQKFPASLVTTFADDPMTTRAFTWYTDDTVENTVIQAVPAELYEALGDDAFAGNNVMEERGDTDSLQTDPAGEFRHFHKVQLTDLEPGTAYCYRVGDGEYWSPVYRFATEGEDEESFTFFSVTDTQASGENNFTNYQNYADLLELATQTYPDGRFVLHSGDLVQNNTLAHYDKIIELTQDHAANLPLMLTAGNHELGKDSLTYVRGLDNFTNRFQFPENGPKGSQQTVYSFDYGNAHIAVLDSNKTVPYGDQISWLKKDMNGSDKPWKIVSIHVGPYNNYGKGTASLINAMDELGVDLVIFGHNHAFLRSNAIKGGVTDASEAQYRFVDGDGVIYYSPGCAGSSASFGGGSDAGKTDPEDMACTYFPVRVYAEKQGRIYAAITVTDTTLTVTSHSSSQDEPVDAFVITKPDAAVSATPTVVEGLVYSGEKQTLITAGTAETGVMLYSLDGETYSEELPAAKDAGTYTVYYKAGGIDHTDTEPGTLEVTIAPKDITGATVVLGDQLTYNGQTQTQQVESVTVDGLEATFDVTGNTATNAGNYTLTVIGSGNFAGEITVKWSIAKLDISSAEVILGDQLTYNGQTQTQQVESVTVDGLEATFDVTGNTATNAGNYILTVIGSGNFAGEITVKWSILSGWTPITPVGPKPKPSAPADEETDQPGEDASLTVCAQDQRCPIASFTDATPTAWYHDGVHFCLAKGLMKGTGDSTFSPTSNITREQVWMMLARLSGAQPATMAEARDWAMANGVSDGTNPLANITREQLATMLFRYAKLMGYDVSVGEDTNILSYVDVFSVSEYAIPAMQWSCGAGVIGGFTDGTLRPLNNASRAEAAAMFQRFCELVIR